MSDKLKALPQKIWASVSRHIGLKLLSLLCAMLLWTFVANNTSIMRQKTIGGLDAYINGQTTLSSYGLALASDPYGALSGISVLLEVQQSEYAYASRDNVQVTLDLTSVRSAGTQNVALKATTSYGKVVRIYPDTLTLTFETLDSRPVPINVTLTGAEQEGLWFNKSRINPQQLTISGAASTVQSISYASVAIDVSGRTDSYTTAAQYTLYDEDGNEIPQSMLTRSASSVTVAIEVYPTRELIISADVEDVLSGQLADGYYVESIVIQPESVTVAAEADLLDNLTELLIEPIEIDGASQSFSRRVSLAKLADIKNISAEQVYVSVQIAEVTSSARIDDVSLIFIAKGEGLTLSWQREDFSIIATGPKSQVEALATSGISATIDLSGLMAGEYNLPLVLPAESYPNITFELSPATVLTTLDDLNSGE